MSETYQFSAEHALSGRLSQLTPQELVTLIDGLCEGITALDVPFYGGVNAANISLDDEGAVGLGDPLEEGNVRYTADQIEFLAPEVFWNDERSPRADVYSVGILLYAWSNGGCLPYLYPDATPTDRAEALRRRMSGEALVYSNVSETLNRIVRKAVAFKAADRYESVADLQEAFKAFAAEVEERGEALIGRLDKLKEKQNQETLMMANILAAAQAAANSNERTPQPAPKPRQKAAEPAPKQEPKKMSLRPLVAVLLIAAILMVAAVAMQFGNGIGGSGSVDTSNTPAVPTADPNTSPDITPTPTPTPDVTPTPTPAPTPNYDMRPYTLYKANVSWNAAAESCIGAGGHLVSISNKEEFDAVTALADKYGLQAFWVGAFRKSGNIVWLDGSTCSHFPWAAGEPTKGNQHFIMLVKENGTWAYRDMTDNGYTGYNGAVGYILEK